MVCFILPLTTCSCLQEDRVKLDQELAALDPEALPAAMRHGIAPAMKAEDATNDGLKPLRSCIPNERR